MTFPFPMFVPPAARVQGSAISTSGLTKIGDMASLSAAFDGTTSQDGASSANKIGSPGYAGVTLAASTRIWSVDTYGGNNTGYDGNSSSSTITLTLYAKTGSAPATATDGTALGSTTFTNSNAVNQKTITSSDKETQWAHVWLVVTAGAGEPRLAELVIYQSV